MLYVAIDTNIYLEFYHFSKDDLEELKKLTTAVNEREIRLFFNEQIRDEIARNRERVIANAVKVVRTAKPAGGFPRVLRNYDEFDDLDAARNDYITRLEALIEKASADAKNLDLPADTLILDLMRSVEILPVGQQILEAARVRYDRGNPPGKSGSYGDAIVWESLLESHPEGEDLHLVTNDQDYISPLDSTELHQFLLRDWRERMRSDVVLHSSLTDFFATHYPGIKLSAELERQFAVNRLVSSWSFDSTHQAVAKLDTYGDFSSSQLHELAEAAKWNSQVRQIVQDDDVHAFFSRILANQADELEDGDVTFLREALED